jgi:hypothetical protein
MVAVWRELDLQLADDYHRPEQIARTIAAGG